MSKITKLIKDPVLFFKDALKNKEKSLTKKAVTKKAVTKKAVTKKAVTKKAVTKELAIAPVLMTNQFHSFEMYTHVLCSGEGENGINHLDLWIPLFDKLDIKFFILVRHLITYDNVKMKYPFVPLVFAKSGKEIDMVFHKQHYIKAFFYPSNNGNNIDLLKFNKSKHIFIGHGDSDKLTSAHKRFRVYDENWVAGEAHIDRFKNANFDSGNLKHVKVGRPNLIDIINKGDTYWKIRFDNIRLLYLSTWEGSTEEQNYSSVDIAYIFLTKIYLSFNIIKWTKQRNEQQKFLKNSNKISIAIKLHPALGIRDINKKLFSRDLSIKFKNQNTKVNFYQNSLISDLVLQYNIFICDISGVVTECLAMNAPIFLYIPKDKEIKLSKSKMEYSYYTYTFSTSDELLKKFKQVVIDEDDYLKKNREDAIEYILGKHETLNNTFENKLLEIKEEINE